MCQSVSCPERKMLLDKPETHQPSRMACVRPVSCWWKWEMRTEVNRATMWSRSSRLLLALSEQIQVSTPHNYLHSDGHSGSSCRSEVMDSAHVLVNGWTDKEMPHTDTTAFEPAVKMNTIMSFFRKLGGIKHLKWNDPHPKWQIS